MNYAVRFLFANIPRLFGAVFVAVAGLCFVATAACQNTAVMASVPNGTASNEMLQLTLRDAINMALRYNLGAIESGENAQTAYKSRGDFRAALDSQKAAQQTLSAAKGERYPVVAMNGDYSDLGTTFGHSHGNFDFQAGVSVPLFTGGRIKGDITQAEAALRQRKAEARRSLPADTFLVCYKTGTLPQIRHCHAGTLMYGTVFRFPIAIQINKFRNPGSPPRLASVLHYSLE